MIVSSHNRQTRLGLAALLLTTCLGTSGWAQAADEAQSKGKIEARSELFARITPISSPAGKAPARAASALTPWRTIRRWWCSGPATPFQGLQQAARPLLCADRRAGNPAHRRPKTAEDGPLPMACWSCKGPDVARVIDEKGEDGYFKGMWAKGGPEIVNTIGCADCHDTASKEFRRANRPAPLPSLCRPGHDRHRQAVQGAGALRSAVPGVRPVPRGVLLSGPTKAVKFPWDKGHHR